MFDYSIFACVLHFQSVSDLIIHKKTDFSRYLHVAIFSNLKGVAYFEIIFKCADIDPGHSLHMVSHNASQMTSISLKIKKLLRRVDVGDVDFNRNLKKQKCSPPDRI